jgi:hypothetical protein
MLAFTTPPTLAAASEFKLERYFAGRTVAEGRFNAINGVSRSFQVILTGAWDGKRLKLVEDFVYDDGERDRKTWRFTRIDANTYSGTREDVVGATTVKVRGNTARFSYLVYLDGAVRKNLVRFHDKMVLNADGTVTNTALVTKFGFPVAKTRVDFRRE